MADPVNIFAGGGSGGRTDVGALAQSSETAVFVYDIPPGAASCPYHYEYVEEWLLVVEGAVVVRTPDGERGLQRGDLVCFPAGPAGAHKISNRGDVLARTLLFSGTRAPAVTVYPDSDKVAVWPATESKDELIFVRDSAVAWSHGEDGWNEAD